GQIEHAPRPATATAAAAAATPPISSYLKHSSPTVRAAALNAIGKLKDRSALAAVRQLMDGSDPVVITAAVRAAAALGDQDAVTPILSLATQVPTYPDIAEPLASALVDLKAPVAKDILLPWLQLPHVHPRHVAQQYLPKLGVAVPSVAPRVAEATA